ncbi:MAG: histidinol dehydrogenase [Verrucomicrobiota bacterium]
MKVLSITEANVVSTVQRFQKSVSFSTETSNAVRPILEAVRNNGDRALRELTQKFDGIDLPRRRLRITASEMELGWSRVSPKDRRAIKSSIRSIRHYHKKCLPVGWTGKNEMGMTVGERFYPLGRVGLYVPGGQVPLVSTVLMTVVPAQVAGVAEIALCTPPDGEGTVSDGLLAAFHALGLKEVYRIGGAQAIGAMAYGTQTVPAVDLIAGPGNAFVMEAKRQVFGSVGVDLLPGPSEVMVVADEGATTDWVASDLLSQAEHGTGKEKLYLAVPSQKVWKRIEVALKKQVSRLSADSEIPSILKNRFLIGICPTVEATVAFANAIAPEHLELQVAPNRIAELTRRITTAGAILQGYETPTVLGDFVAGPSHTLPTDGTGRFSGGLQAIDFMRRSSLVRSNQQANRIAIETVEAFAEMESLPIHGDSLKKRLEK